MGFFFRSGKINKSWSVISLFVLLLTIMLTACGENNTTTNNTQNKATVPPPNNLITSGVLTVGSDTTYPPQEYIDTATGNATGFDIDVIKAVAERMGLRVNVVSTSFDSLLGSLNVKRFDVVISAVTISDERKQKFDFVPYFNAGESLLVPKGNPKNLTLAAHLCGYNVAVQNGTVEQKELQQDNDACLKANKPAINITVLQDQSSVIQALATGRVDATYQDSPVTDYYLKQHPNQFSVGGSVFNAAPEGIVVRKNDTAMFNAIQTAFHAIKTDGTYTSLINKWGLTSGALAS